MFELGLGFFLAAWFIAAYYLYRRLFRRDDEAWAQPVINTPETLQLEEKETPKFLPTADLSRHHAGETQDFSEDSPR
jgi:hypothetical protein